MITDVKIDKKVNMAYWDAIDHAAEKYASELLKLSTKKINPVGSSYNEEDIKEMDKEEIKAARDEAILEIGKVITEFTIDFLEKEYGAEFPYVDEDY